MPCLKPPRPSIVRSIATVARAVLEPVRESHSARAPIQIRYSAPTSFSESYTVAELRIAATPRAVASVQTERPTFTPIALPSAASRPWISAFLVTTAVSGPGSSMIATTTPM